MANAYTFILKSTILPGEEKVLEKFGVEKSGKVQQFIDTECLKRMDPYVPLDVGNLRDDGVINTEIGSGLVVYTLPYARRQYYMPYAHGNGKKRTSYWFEHMKSDGGKDAILRGVKKMTGAN